MRLGARCSAKPTLSLFAQQAQCGECRITKYDSVKGYMFNIALLRKVFAPSFQMHDLRCACCCAYMHDKQCMHCHDPDRVHAGAQGSMSSPAGGPCALSCHLCHTGAQEDAPAAEPGRLCRIMQFTLNRYSPLQRVWDPQLIFTGAQLPCTGSKFMCARLMCQCCACRRLHHGHQQGERYACSCLKPAA